MKSISEYEKMQEEDKKVDILESKKGLMVRNEDYAQVICY